MDDRRGRTVWESAGIATLTFLALTLPLRGATTQGRLGAFILLATLIGTVCGRRRPVRGPRIEQLLYRSAYSALIASIVLVILIGVAR